MVAQGRCLEAHRVEEGDVGPPVAGHAQNGVVGAIGGREESPKGFRRPYIRTKENSASA